MHYHAFHLKSLGRGIKTWPVLPVWYEESFFFGSGGCCSLIVKEQSSILPLPGG